MRISYIRTFFAFSLLLLCGDIHPNPGPGMSAAAEAARQAAAAAGQSQQATPQSVKRSRRKQTFLPAHSDHPATASIYGAVLMIATGHPLMPAVRSEFIQYLELSEADIALVASHNDKPFKNIGAYIKIGALRRAFQPLSGSALLKRIRGKATEYYKSHVAGSAVCCACAGPAAAPVVCSCGALWHPACAIASLPTADQHIVPQSAFLLHEQMRFTCLACTTARQVVRPGPPETFFEAIRDMCSMSRDDIHDAADANIDAALRRRFRGIDLSRRRPHPDRALFVAFCRYAEAQAAAGSAAAELAITLAPRLLLRKVTSVLESLEAIRNKKTTDHVRPAHSAAGAVEAALATGRIHPLLRALEREVVPSEPPDPDQILKLFPVQQLDPNEEEKLDQLRGTFNDIPTFSLTREDVLKWARKNPLSSGGFTGWTGFLLIALDKDDRVLFNKIVKLWARPPEQWADPKTAELAYRMCDGWLFQKPPDPQDPQALTQWRPIAAPQTMRRAYAAAALSTAWPLLQRYCEQRGQFGLSKDSEVLAFGIVPALAAKDGAYVCTADRSMSYQTIDRTYLVKAVDSLVQSTLPRERYMAAAFLDALKLLWTSSPNFGLSKANFAAVPDIQLVDIYGLPQGCALSIASQALVIAHAMERQQLPSGQVFATIHDDSWIVAKEVKPQHPQCDYGGSYNVKKGNSTESGRPVAIYGRPITQHADWAATVWLDKFKARLNTIRETADQRKDLAIRAAHKLGGPGGSAQHWLRTCTEADLPGVRQTLASADAMWVDLLADLCGAKRYDAEILRKRVFGPESVLGHVSAEYIAQLMATGGMASGFIVARKYARNRGFDTSGWASHLGHKGLPTDVEVQKFLDERHQDAAKVCTLSRKTDINLWQLALGSRGSFTDAHHVIFSGRFQTPSQASVLQFALSRALRLPVWPAIIRGVEVPVQACTLCKAKHTHVPQTLDELAMHMSTCKSMYRVFSNKLRHDLWVKGLAEIARQAGFDAGVHDGPIFRVTGAKGESRLRPADWFEVDADRKKHPAGVALDATIRSCDRNELEAEARKKREKYRTQLEARPDMGFVVFGATQNGDLCKDAEEVMTRWASRLRANRRDDGLPIGQPMEEVAAAVAFAFAVVHVAQAQAYLAECAAGMNIPSALRKLTRTGRLVRYAGWSQGIGESSDEDEGNVQGTPQPGLASGRSYRSENVEDVSMGQSGPSLRSDSSSGVCGRAYSGTLAGGNGSCGGVNSNFGQ